MGFLVIFLVNGRPEKIAHFAYLKGGAQLPKAKNQPYRP